MKNFLLRNLSIALLASSIAGFTSCAQAQTAPEEVVTSSAATDQMAMSEVTVVDLTQIPGEFNTKHLDLAAGQYQFSVTNESVDHEVGFFIQKAADKDGAPEETAVENSFTTAPVAEGNTERTGIVTLTPGEYVYSCPLNPTPHYTLTVK